ncbi:MAG: aminoglycoside phosphotransferase family protein [Deltaproteobacteria bacterium]|nr:aminoglycoside phosphotransferase family protein [Deltaproteobacteria bacterium]
MSGGLINDTFVVGAPPRAVVQRLHLIFDPVLHEDIEAITAHLAAKGLLTPRLLRTDSGDLFTLDDEGRCWRALSWVPGESHDRVTSPALAAEGGALVGRWHAATSDLQHTFAFTRPGAHDTHRHMQVLRDALDAHPSHRLRDEVAPLADRILADWERWQGRLTGPTRIGHGDLKISNLRFDADGQGLCLLDLDTMASLSLDIEMGDAMRSWCNPAGEDVAEARFDAGIFSAAIGAWLTECPQPAEEREALVPGIQRICLELAARFAADALNEAYFGWDPSRFATRGAHNLLRAQGQASLAASVEEQRATLSESLRS